MAAVLCDLGCKSGSDQGGCWRKESTPPTFTPHPHPSTILAPPLYARTGGGEAQRLFNNSLLQLFSMLRLGVVGSMGATNQQGVPVLAAAQKEKKKFQLP